MKFLVGDPVEFKKEEFVEHLMDIQQRNEISWLITDSRSFEWNEINEEKQAFIKELRSTDFSSACIGVFDTESKNTEYSSFKITH